mmetsp:Transcript_8432/g.16380  ORF Transcript_8432/g.16380 Transcript_8432/m.16380 type:complete len:356 (+) Transcript_8432:640-1707(+)
MTAPAQVNHAHPRTMVEADGVLSVLRGSHAPADNQMSPLEIFSQTNIKSHIRVVGVHIQTEVLALLVPHSEAVVPVDAVALERKERLCERLENLLSECKHEGCHADVVKDETVGVHRVRSVCGQVGGSKRIDFLKQRSCQSVRQKRKSENSFGHFCVEKPPLFPFPHCPLFALFCPLKSLPRFPKVGMEPFFLPRRGALEEHPVLALRPIGADHSFFLRLSVLGCTHVEGEALRQVFCLYSRELKRGTEERTHCLENRQQSAWGVPLLLRQCRVEACRQKPQISHERVRDRTAHPHLGHNLGPFVRNLQAHLIHPRVSRTLNSANVRKNLKRSLCHVSVRNQMLIIKHLFSRRNV